MENLSRYVLSVYQEPFELREIKFEHSSFEYKFKYDIGQVGNEYSIYVFNDEKYLFPDLEQRFFMKIDRSGNDVIYDGNGRPSNVQALLSILSQKILVQFRAERE